MNTSKNQISLANVSKYLLVILIPFLIVLINFNYLSFNRTFFKKIQGQIQSNVSLDNRILYTNNVIDYYSNIKLLDVNFYSYQAQLHLAQVKDLLNATKIIIALNIIVILLLITILVHEKRYEIIFTAMFYSGLICLSLFLLLGIGISKYFDFLFLNIHKLLFTDTLWLFPSTDTLIQVFPNEFFVLFARQFAINVMITSGILAAVSFVTNIVIHRASHTSFPRQPKAGPPLAEKRESI